MYFKEFIACRHVMSILVWPCPSNIGHYRLKGKEEKRWFGKRNEALLHIRSEIDIRSYILEENNSESFYRERSRITMDQGITS